MFSFLRGQKNFSLKRFKKFRATNPNQDVLLASLICKPIFEMGEFMRSEFWSDDRQFASFTEKLNIVLHYTPKQTAKSAIANAMEKIERSDITHTARQAILFTEQLWTNSLAFPSFENGGKADFSSLEEAKTESFKMLQKEFIELAQQLNVTNKLPIKA